MISRTERGDLFAAVFIVIAFFWLLEATVHAFVFQTGDFIHQLLAPDANELWMRSIITILIIGIGLYIRTVFNQQQQQLATLQQSKKRLADANGSLEATTDLLRDILESIPARVFWKDRNSRFLGCNTSFAMDAGCSGPGDMIGKLDADMGWREQAERYRADDRVVMESGRPRLAYEEPQTTPDGRTIWLRTSKVPLKDRQGSTIGILGIYEDVTEQKQVSRMLQAMVESMVGVSGEEFFRRAVRSLCDFLGVDCAVISEIVDGQARALAMQIDGEYVDKFEYELRGTPCDRVAAEGYRLYPERVCELFPDDEDLVRMRAEAYVGLPVRDRQGECVGILCAISRRRLELSEQTRGLFDVIAAKAASEIESRRIMQKRTQLLEQNRYLARSLLSAQEKERRNIARDLHDEVGQALVALRAYTAMIRRHSRSSRVLQQVEQAEGVIDHMHAVVRSIRNSLQPTSIDELGLQMALTGMIADWQTSSGIGCNCQIDEEINNLDYEVAVACFRTVQEALTNIARHSGAGHASIQVGLRMDQGGGEHALCLEVSDDGCGLQEARLGMGLSGMRERVEALTGTLAISSPDGGGARIVARIPVPGKTDG